LKTLFLILIIIVFTINVSAQISNSELKENSSDKLLIYSKEKSEKPKDFTFNANVYLWALSLDGEAALPLNNQSIPQTPVVDVRLGFSDAIKNLKMAAMFTGRFGYKNWGLLYDVNYVKLVYAGTLPVSSGYVSGNLTAKQFTGDISIGYRYPLANKNILFESYVGTRISSLDNTLDLVASNQLVYTYNAAQTWIDPIIGADAKIPISRHWFSYFKGDLGGLGSKFTTMILGVAGYKFSENWNTTIGFKYLYMNHNKDNYLWRVNQYGLLLSAGYMF
jgi:hypothetical protein